MLDLGTLLLVLGWALLVDAVPPHRIHGRDEVTPGVNSGCTNQQGSCRMGLFEMSKTVFVAFENEEFVLFSLLV